jgi:hypothetical protein
VILLNSPQTFLQKVWDRRSKQADSAANDRTQLSSFQSKPDMPLMASRLQESPDISAHGCSNKALFPLATIHRAR